MLLSVGRSSGLSVEEFEDIVLSVFFMLIITRVGKGLGDENFIPIIFFFQQLRILIEIPKVCRDSCLIKVSDNLSFSINLYWIWKAAVL